MKRRIFLTAGHHLKDSGAVGNGRKENSLTIEIRDMITERLKALSPDIVVWNDNDNDTLAQVIAQINKIATKDDFLLELHFDSSISPKASGATALVAEGARQNSKDFGKELADLGSAIMRVPNRGVKFESQSNRGRLGILHTAASSVLYEVGFISNPTDVVNYENWKHWLADDFARIIIKRLEM
ncbi:MULTISPECIES: N-acetylmuramoyl-L-alanine amidase [unclassified Sphingobacterium]|uniref:N-acetylmuramoyl-L-alanine amidase n=1 Tax=unclassified Sphingobacterium TaxID=2609468 RepID=UPI0025CEF1C3|nr:MULTISPECIES: N-acetylmuramoyl-L-alanine amidase [unclassified Sphingobacterium]